MAVSQIPNEDSTISTGGGQKSTLCGKCKRINWRFVSSHESHLVSGQTVPQSYCHITRSCCNVIGIWMKLHNLQVHNLKLAIHRDVCFSSFLFFFFFANLRLRLNNDQRKFVKVDTSPWPRAWQSYRAMQWQNNIHAVKI